ncbi:hypothetical protein QO209_23575 [Pseudomonas citronellolis]|uniref:hypothetical protein n=1 Tax=Pseudomonas citronellolis TaxID=53408 RepID=UPI002648E70C|nr:hypothetical protein [Pseudomonas citronellolis]MDN6875431.1 hypothetical protein [Pseudomonas citronellolis]
MPITINRRLIEYAYSSGLYSKNDRVILAGTPLTETEHQLLGDITRRFTDLVFKVFEQTHRSSYNSFGQQLGKPRSLIELITSLSLDGISRAILARGDIIRTSEGFKIIELNLGSQIGGLYYASLPRLAGFAQTYDALDHWAMRLCNQIPDQQAMVFTDSVSNVAWMAPYCRQLSDSLKTRTCLDTPLVDSESFSYRDGQLFAAGKVVSWVYSWMSDIELHDGQARMQPLIKAVKDGAARFVMSPLAPVFADKGVFAELWLLHEKGGLNASDSAFLEAHVPYTRWLSNTRLEWLLAEQKRLVVKPADGYGGHGVVVGADLTHQAWRVAVNDLLERDDGQRQVVQMLATPEVQRIGIGQWDASSSWEESHVVWGAFVENGTYLGTYARSKPKDASMVINQGNGAAVGPITPLH